MALINNKEIKIIIIIYIKKNTVLNGKNKEEIFSLVVVYPILYINIILYHCYYDYYYVIMLEINLLS